MKPLRFAPLLLGLMWLTACDDTNDDGSLFQNHDQNAMVMHMEDMITRLDTMTPSDDPNYDFVRMSLVAHEHGLDMIQMELQSGDDQTLKNMATTMQAGVQNEIAMLTAYRDAYGAPKLDDPAFTQESMQDLEVLRRDVDMQDVTGDADFDFAVMMIVHHHGEVNMGETLLAHTQDAQLAQMVKASVALKKTELVMLEDWVLTHKPY